MIRHIRQKQYIEPRLVSQGKQQKPSRSKAVGPQKNMVIVDGYNLIYADERLQSTALFSLEKVRKELIDLLCNYVSYTKTELILVFEAYLVKDGEGSEFMHNGYKVVYNKANQTADAYIEKMMYDTAKWMLYEYGIFEN